MIDSTLNRMPTQGTVLDSIGKNIPPVLEILDSTKVPTTEVVHSDISYNIQYIHLVLAFITGTFIVGIVWILVNKNKSKHSKKSLQSGMRPNDEISDLWLRNENYKLKSKIHNLEEEVVRLKAEIRKLQEVNEKAERTISELQDDHDTPSLNNSPSNKEIPVDSTNYQYFPSPLSDGSFRKIDGKAQFIEGASIYRFTIISDSEARFEFCDDKSSVSMALNNRNDLILTVADEMEGSSAGATKILTYKGMKDQIHLK
jgi:hypothetical protein